MIKVLGEPVNTIERIHEQRGNNNYNFSETAWPN